jgi:hypothetical protein
MSKTGKGRKATIAEKRLLTAVKTPVYYRVIPLFDQVRTQKSPPMHRGACCDYLK